MSLFGRDKGQEIVVKIEGMSCMHCVGKVEKGLKGLDGVLSATVDLEGKQATIRYDPEKVTPESIRKTVTETGYQAV
jgi:copper ion binding protein